MTGVKVAGPGGNVPIDRAMTWMGETLTTITDNVVTSDSQTFTYTPTHRLATAAGAYGVYAWAYDGVGNRTSEQLGAALSTYAYPTTSNRLASITPAAGTARNFTYDPAGAIATDTRGAGPALTLQYDQEGRLAKAFETATPANGGTYAYDARWRLSSRTVTQTAAPTSATVLYVYDQADHIIAELDTNGQTQREYIWLDDTPVAVVDGIAAGTPTFYYVHVDHLNRPIRMTTQTRGRAWEAKYAPFGTTTSIFVNPAMMNLRFPGQWFQLETGLAYNWHRHYDATTGRYVQPDPLVVDDGEAKVSGLAMDIFNGIQNNDGDATAKRFGWKTTVDIAAHSWTGAMLQDGPGIYGYTKQNPLSKVDPKGLGPDDFLIPSPGDSDADKVCRVRPRDSGDCSEGFHEHLQDVVDKACKPLPPDCHPGDTCSSVKARALAFGSCADARQQINKLCFRGGDVGHQMAYTFARQRAATCIGLLPTCVP